MARMTTVKEIQEMIPHLQEAADYGTLAEVVYFSLLAMKNNSQKYYKSMFKNYPDVVNVKELQLMLGGISKKLTYDLLKNNLINSTKIGREYKIAKIDVILYLTEKENS